MSPNKSNIAPPAGSSAVTQAPGPLRRYDKGERRTKHMGRSSVPEVVFEGGNPRKAIGKCPNTIDQPKRTQILQAAISNPDPDVPYEKTLYAVHEGTIYECQSSDRGQSYHAYPYHGDMTQGLLDRLAQIKDATSHAAAFKDWVNLHIHVLGTGK